MASLWRAAWVPVVLVTMAVLPSGTSPDAASAAGAADSTDTLRVPRQVIRVRLRAPHPGGVRIRSVHDNRVRVIHLPRMAMPDSLRAVPAAPATVAPPPTIDITSLEASLREYLDSRLQQLQSQQSAALATLSASVAADSAATAATAATRAASPETATPAVSGGTATETGQSSDGKSKGLLAGAAVVGGSVVVTKALSGNDSTAADTTAVPDTTVAAGVPADSAVAIAPVPDSLSVREHAMPLQPTVELVERAVLDTGLLRTVNVVFEVNEASLLPTSLPVLNSLGRVLVRYPDIRLEIGGHTDSVGAAEYNLILSGARADSVRTYLLSSFPIGAPRLTTRGYGETRPIAGNETATGRTLNRRVEFSVLLPDTTRR